MHLGNSLHNSLIFQHFEILNCTKEIYLKHQFEPPLKSTCYSISVLKKLRTSNEYKNNFMILLTFPNAIHIIPFESRYLTNSSKSISVVDKTVVFFSLYYNYNITGFEYSSTLLDIHFVQMIY